MNYAFINQKNTNKESMQSRTSGLKCKNKLISNRCPAYIIGNYNQADVVFFWIKPRFIISTIMTSESKSHCSLC